MRIFTKLSDSSYGALIITISLLFFLGFVTYLISPGSNKLKQKQSVDKILPNKHDEVRNRQDTIPSITIVVIGLGMDKSLFEKAMKLPKQVTLGLSPYSPYLDYILKLTQKGSRDVIMNMPVETTLMETSNYTFEDNGPYVLLSDLGNAENSERLDCVISKGREVVRGYYMSLYDSFTDIVENLTFLLGKVKETGKYVMYNDPRKIKPFGKVATKLQMQDKIIKADILLDSDLEESKIKSELNELKNVADAYGYAVGIVQAYHISVGQVDKWLKTVDKDARYNVIPLSKLINKD